MAKTLDAAGVKRLIQEIKGANKNLNIPIPISTENTPESMAQNVKNIADYVEKAKAAGIANVDGMGVTCLINGGISGLGYIYVTGNSFDLIGMMMGDDMVDNAFFMVSGGEFNSRKIAFEGTVDTVTSDMLVEGARKPIILTPSTTEVDEETYQKLLSDDVDVVFMTSTGDANHCTFTYKYDDGDVWSFTFTGFSHEGVSLSETYLYGYEVRITKTGNPHQCEVINNSGEIQFDSILLNEGFIRRTTLSPVLKEIDLSGTDADRKAKLDQFETDWKALTGASDLTGARFVGYMETPGYLSTMFALNSESSLYEGVGTDDFKRIYKVQTDPSSGKIYYTPLFYHLEPVEIFDDNSIESKKKNIDNIEAYKSNLEELGVDTSISFQVPIYRKSNSVVEESGFLIYSNLPGVYKPYSGLFLQVDGTSFNIFGISSAGEFIEQTYYLANINYSSLTTTSKKVIDAINEVNALAEKKADKSLNAKSLEAITIKTGNTPENKAANVAAIEAYVDNLTALGVDVTKGYMIPCKFPNSVAGVLSAVSNSLIVAITTNGRGELNCYEVYIGGDNPGAVYTIGGFQLKISSALTTTSKHIVGAINEVNALAKGYSTIFTPIELTTETAQNKTAIDARVAAFTAQGISPTNGCCIPVTYKGVYAGNISLINGDWYGLLVKNTNNPADNINIKLSADGTITEGNSAQ